MTIAVADGIVQRWVAERRIAGDAAAAAADGLLPCRTDDADVEQGENEDVEGRDRCERRCNHDDGNCPALEDLEGWQSQFRPLDVLFFVLRVGRL